MNLDLRPLTVSEFLDRTFSIYRQRFLLFVALMAPQAAMAMLTALVGGWISHTLQFGKNADPMTLLAPLGAAGAGVLAFWLAHWVLYAIGAGATAAAVSDLHGGMRPEAGAAFATARRRLGPLLWLTLLMSVRLGAVMMGAFALPATLLGFAAARGATGGLASGLAVVAAMLLMVGMLIAVVAIVFMLLRYAVAIPAVVLEPIGGRAAIRRSIGLTRGRLLAALALTLCTVAVAFAAAVVLQVPFNIAALVAGPETRSGFVLTMIGTATGTVGQALTAPLVVIGMAVLYFEARVRHEALDLQVMTEALPPTPAAVTPGPGAGPGGGGVPGLTAPPPLPH